MKMTPENVQQCRRQFPALARTVAGSPAAFFDGPAGTQVPQRVIDAMADYLTHRNANFGGQFVTSRESDLALDQARRAVADLLGCDDPGCIAFGPNMTTLTLQLARAMAQGWGTGDEILVTRLDHDANVSPWVLAARDVGATVRSVRFRPEDCTLDMEDFQQKLSARTKLVAVGCASNAVGSINPIRTIIHRAHEVGAQVFLDAVHYAPHALIDVQGWDCDFLACSAYKFFGPHVGVLYGKRPWLETLPAYKLRPAPDDPPGKWMTGTQNHEGIVGVTAAIDYLADFGCELAMNNSLSRREALIEGFSEIVLYERHLATRLMAGLQQIPGVRIYGITDPLKLDRRLPTVAMTHPRLTPREVANQLGLQGHFVWHGHFYAISVTEDLGLEPNGLVRIGLVHYNTPAEIDRLLEAIAALS